MTVAGAAAKGESQVRLSTGAGAARRRATRGVVSRLARRIGTRPPRTFGESGLVLEAG